ncbi:hypothetical protein HanRHA438_Chr16g0754741 [Helianthus annuus]|nr:hypothetical protein HanLR1_Chr16g0616441 [Helianthus annuus]KAJ0644457.1 hypothetical protein HanOQP8_Chr16g0612291 [Helianthus annuus]KAJ0820798.1 hypothetical protein HanPSC8_Chr16g0712271 [Helianthus annuus]KAJ0835399.1 hypothetical protein HanRHA438_Chr16g0754741 [Helianthus annuus]
MPSGVCASHIFYFETIITKLFGFTVYPHKLCSLTFRPKREGLGEACGRPPHPTVAYHASGLATVLASRFWRPHLSVTTTVIQQHTDTHPLMPPITTARPRIQFRR